MSAVRVFVLFLLLRIGEATNPGPDNVFVLGTANPSGLRNKAPYVASHMAHGDVWAFSETHLGSKEVGSLNAGLKFAGSPFQPFLGGFPVPSSRTNAGTWKGVGVLSKRLLDVFRMIGRMKLRSRLGPWLSLLCLMMCG